MNIFDYFGSWDKSKYSFSDYIHFIDAIRNMFKIIFSMSTRSIDTSIEEEMEVED